MSRLTGEYSNRRTAQLMRKTVFVGAKCKQCDSNRRYTANKACVTCESVKRAKQRKSK